jgi:predicted acyl esterase
MPLIRLIALYLLGICTFPLIIPPLEAKTATVEEEIKPDITLFIPMRDGELLPTDIYLPYPEASNLPCILLRGPAGRRSPTALVYTPLAKAGYVIAIQDTRAANDKQGKTVPFNSHGWGKEQDGYDTVEWLAKNPLTNGKVGTLGLSNMGITQILLAPTAPPSLKCQYIGVAASSLYHHAIFPGGRLLKSQVEGWLGMVAKDPSVLKFVLEQENNLSFWENLNTLKIPEKVNTPAVHQGGWYDIFLQGTIDAFVSRQTNGGPLAKNKQKLVIGPWIHLYPIVTKLGDFEVPQEGAHPPLDVGPLRWFNYHLKGEENEIDKIPHVIYYVMGPFDGSPSSGNVWRYSDTWPVPHVEVPFYLTADNQLHANSIPKEEKKLSYTTDVNDPVPTIGGRNLFLESGPMDQRTIEGRKDVVLFTTPPLKEDLEVTGRIIAKLIFSSDHEEADVAVRLTDVYPDGRSILVSDALTRTVKTAINNNTQEIEVDLWSTSIVFAKGHSLRISITASNFPRFEKNITLLNQKEKQTHTLHLGGKNPSRLILPVVKKGNG